MTTADDIPNIIIGTGSTVTVYTESVKKTYVKKLVKITPPQSSGNWGAGAKDTKMVDLLRIEVRFAVRGRIDSADQSTLENYFNAGGVFNMTWDGTNYDINMDKLDIEVSAKQGEQDEKSVMFTAIKGIDI